MATPKNESEQSLIDGVLNAFRNATPFSPEAARFQAEMFHTDAARTRVQNRFNAPVAQKAAPAPAPVAQARENNSFFATITVGSEARTKGKSEFYVAFVKQCETGELPVGARIAILAPTGTGLPKGSLVRIALCPVTNEDGNVAVAYDMPKFWLNGFAEVRALKGMAKGTSIVPRDDAGKRTGYLNVAQRWAPKKAPKA